MCADEKIKALNNLIQKSEQIVFFGGAGVSTESGIPDFRSVDGLYSQKYDYPPETILSHSFFIRHPEKFYQFYRDKMLCLEAKPNAAHLALACLEKTGKLTGIVTQNVDGLHQAAGSQKVYELHGSVHRNYCMQCGKIYDALFIQKSEGIPTCSCGGMIRPDVVLYEESLDDETICDAVSAISRADPLIVGGTSLVVYPAAGLIRYFKGQNLVLINKAPTSFDRDCSLLIGRPIGEVFSQIKC